MVNEQSGDAKNATLKNELNILMNHIEDGSADKRQKFAMMKSPKASMKSPTTKS